MCHSGLLLSELEEFLLLNTSTRNPSLLWRQDQGNVFRAFLWQQQQRRQQLISLIVHGIVRILSPSKSVCISTLLHWPVFQLLILRLAFTSHKPLKEFGVGVGVGVGIVSGVVSAHMTLWKSKLGFVSRVLSATESESEESERFHFPPTPLMTPSITINWNQIVGFGGIRTPFSPDRKVLCLVLTIGTESVLVGRVLDHSGL